MATLMPAQAAFAEGSYDLNIGPGTALRNRLAVNAGSNGPDHTGYTVLRAYTRAGETIDMGSSAMGLGGSADILVYAPGTSFASVTEPGRRATLPSDPVFATDIFSCDAADPPGTGRIANRKQEEAGPAPNPEGYTPCHYVAPADGVYAIVMRPYAESGTAGVSTVSNPDTTTGQATAISIWDVTVRDGEVEQSGRVFTNDFQFIIPTAAAAASNLSTYVYTPAGYVYHATIFNPRSKAWDLAADSSGVVDATTGEPISASFRWGPTAGYPATLEPTYGQALAPRLWEGDAADDSRYPLFFRSPDPLVFSGPGGLGETRGYSATPMSPEGGLTPLLSFTGAGGEAGATVQGSGGTIAIGAPQLQRAGYDVTLDLDRDGTFGGGRDVELDGTLSGAGPTTTTWDGRDSTGAVVPCGVSYSYRVTSTLPAMHLVQSDTQNEAGTEIERLSLPADPLLTAPLAASYDDVDPYKGTAVTNAAPSAVSEGISGPTFHAWSAQTGHAVFTDTWAPSRTVNGTGTLTVRCPVASQPVASDSSSTTAAAGSPGSTPPPSTRKHTPAKRHRHHETKPSLKEARLVLSMKSGAHRARPSSVIGYRLVVVNRGDAAARDVVVCDSPPAGQSFLRAVPATGGEGRPCWRLGTLAAHAERILRLTTMVVDDPATRWQINNARASASNVEDTSAAHATVVVTSLPDRACGSSLEGQDPRLPLFSRC